MSLVQRSAKPDCTEKGMPPLVLSQLQWTVVHIAKSDVGDMSRFPRLSLFLARISSVFGIQPKWKEAPPLANPELEALRQYACLCRQGDGAASDLAPFLLAAGIDQECLSALARFVQESPRDN